MSGRLSAGLLLFRRTGRGLEVFLAHPGGPFWARRDAGAWSVPKGEVAEGEAPEDAARREFREETGFSPGGALLELGRIRQKGGKTVACWALEGNVDADAARSNTVELEWPRDSGRRVSFPEVDRCAWFDLDTARRKINAAQAELIDRLERAARPGP